MTFKIGDTVRLKSGGPIMTVEDIDRDEQVICVWFEGKKRHQDRFKIATLDAVQQSVGAVRVSF